MPVLFFLLLFLSSIPRAAGAATGLPFLRLNSGARGTALAEATTALLDDEAIAANPAALSARGRSSVGLTHSEWIRDVRHEYLTLLFARGERVFGLAAQVAQVDGLERRTGPTTESLGEFGVFDGAFNLGFSWRQSPRLRLGINAKLLRQSISTQTATGAAADLGALYRLGPHLRAGLALRNLGGMNKLDRKSTDLPSALRLGFSYAGGVPLLLAGEVQKAAGRETSLHLGGEYALRPGLLLRGGYQTGDSRNLALGLGVVVGLWTVDYAFVPFGEGLGEAHRFSLHLHRG